MIMVVTIISPDRPRGRVDSVLVLLSISSSHNCHRFGKLHLSGLYGMIFIITVIIGLMILVVMIHLRSLILVLIILILDS